MPIPASSATPDGSQAEADGQGRASPLLVIESSMTRQHVLRRVLSARFTNIHFSRSPASALELLRQQSGQNLPAAVLWSLDIAPLPYSDELLSYLRAPEALDCPVLILVHAAEPNTVEWVSRRARSAILLWQDFTDSADCLVKLLAPTPDRSGSLIPDGEPIRVLFVDDSRTVRAAYGRTLAEQGYAVEVAANAAEAWAITRTQTFDIAIIDYFMPEENGDSLCRRLRQDPRTAGMTTAILTGTYLDQVIRDCLKAGAVECMLKSEAVELFTARLAAMSRATRARKSVEAERSRLTGILGSIGEGVYGVNRAGLITFINPAARRILGYAADDPLIGQAAHRLFHTVAEDGSGNPDSACPLQKAYAAGAELRNWETVFLHKNRSSVAVECTVFPLQIEGQLEGSVVAFRDISERRALERELLWQANHDPLTKLFNRRHFEKQLDEEMARCRRGARSALLYLDLDRFKYINDTAGHAAGDLLLIEISRQMRERLRDADLLARMGGDEFAIILRNVADEQVMQAAESFREILERYTFVYGENQFRIYGSVGVALMGPGAQSSGEVLANADIACHIAKNKGRNQTHLYQPSDDDRVAVNADLGWSNRLQQALKSDGFELHYQPIVALQQKAGAALASGGGGGGGPAGVRHFEALLRLTDRGNGLVRPNTFMPTAERFGLMPQIDLWVIRQAIQQLAAYQQHGDRACVSVNLSGHTLDHESLAAEITAMLGKYRVDPQALIFDITETSAIANIEAARRLIHPLHELGCRFALDDFGSGFSSFNHLKHLPVDFVKIDGQLVRGIARDAADRAIVMSINDIAHSFGKRTVAEFVENRETLRWLQHCGVDYAQGYGLAPPSPGIQRTATDSAYASLAGAPQERITH